MILLPLPKLRLPLLKFLLPSFALSNERKEISVFLLRSSNTNQPSNPNSQILLLPYFSILQIFRFHIPNFALNQQQWFSKIFYFTNYLIRIFTTKTTCLTIVSATYALHSVTSTEAKRCYVVFNGRYQNKPV